MVEADIGFTAALSSAYRRAAWLGLPVVNTDLVLYYAVSRSPVIAQQLPPIFDPAWRPVWRGRSGLTDPDPPAASRFTPVFDEEVALQTDAVLRLAVHDGSQSAQHRARYTRRPPRLPTFSPAVRYAVFTGLQEAGRSGLSHVGPLHLIVGLLSVPEGAAGWIMKLLTDEEWGPGWAPLVELTQIARETPGRPPTDMIDSLVAARVLPVSREPRFWNGPWRIGVWWIATRYFRRPYRRHGAMYGHPVLFMLQSWATSNAALTGHTVITGAHLLVSLLGLHEQLAAAGRTLPEPVAQWNEAGEILSRHGVTRLAALRGLHEQPDEPADDEERLDELPTRGWPPIRKSLGTPVPGRTALAALRGASLAAHRQGHPYAGTTHLLVELLADPAGPAARLLRHLQIDPEAIRAEALQSRNRPVAAREKRQV